MNADSLFTQVSAEFGCSFDGTLRIGGDYVPLVRDGGTVYVSGQIPRVGDAVAVTGPVGRDVDLVRAQQAAGICALRALAFLQRELGTLDQVRQVLRISVYVRCEASFTQHSEVADGASAVLQRVLGPAGRHTRTSVGVLQLPKGASVELDLIAAVHP